MNLEELRTVRRKERQKDSLQHLRDSFYTDVASYIEELKAERRRAAEAADDPFASPEVGRLTDEIETAEEVVEAIYERRVGKVVKLSSFAAADMSTEEEGLTAEERRLFDDLVGRIKDSRSTVLDILGGEGPATTDEATTDDDAAPDTGTGPGVSVDVAPGEPDEAEAAGGDAPDQRAEGVLADAMGSPGGAAESTDGGGASAPAEDDSEPSTAAGASGESTEDADDRTTVRITRDVGRIFGVDEREYELADEDVVTLPTPNAEPLLDRDAAERID